MNKIKLCIPVILNLILPGSGYLYTGKKERRVIGIVLLLWTLYDIANWIIYTATGTYNPYTIPLYLPSPIGETPFLNIILLTIMSFDTYHVAKNHSKKANGVKTADRLNKPFMPAIAVIFNLAIPGCGYIYIGKKERRIVGALLYVWSLCAVISWFVFAAFGHSSSAFGLPLYFHDSTGRLTFLSVALLSAMTIDTLYIANKPS